MTEEFDIIEIFQRMRQRLHDTQQPRNLGSIAAALQPTTLQLNHDDMTVPPLPPDLDWRPVHTPVDWQIVHRESLGQAALYVHDTLNDLEEDEDEDNDNDEELFDIMDCMAWAYMPDEIQNEIRSRFYNGTPAIHQILLTMPSDEQRGGTSVTAATVVIRRDNHTVQLLLCNEVIAWYTSTSIVVDDKYHPIFFVYDYAKLGRFFLGAAQVLWNALGYPVCIESERYIWDDETTPWEMVNDAELRDYQHNRIKQLGQLFGNSGVLKPKVRNARRRRN